MIRKLGAAGFGCLLAALLWCSQPPMQAQGKKDELAKQNQQLKKALAEKDRQIAALHAQAKQAKQDYDAYKKKNPGASKLQKDLDKANQSLKDKNDLIASLQKSDPSTEIASLRRSLREFEALKKAALVHTVILKLKKEDDAQVKKIYDEAAKTIAKIDGVRGVWVGKPAENGTPDLAQKGYQIGVTILFDDADALQKYLDDPQHKQFVAKMADYWDRPVVYDFQRDPEAKKDPKKDAN